MAKVTTKTAERSAAERAERAEMFGFAPEILARPMPLPRRTDGKKYTGPEEVSGGDEAERGQE